MFKKILALVGLILSLPANAAAVQYTYEGNDLDKIESWLTPQCPNNSCPSEVTSLYFSFELSAPIGPNSTYSGALVFDAFDVFYFTDGYTEIDDLSTYSARWELHTDSEGNIDTWLFSIAKPVNTLLAGDFFRMHSSWGLINFIDYDLVNYCAADECGAYPGMLQDTSPGTWTMTVSPVPVPAAAWLFGSALIGLAGIKRKK